jgi:fermentation-respiration switch protein FrsA (DUF1100 family)
MLPEGGDAVTLTTADGLDLGAWFLPAPDPGPIVLLTNGNAGNRADRLPLALGLRQRACSVLMLDYRGYGGNPGEPTEEGLIADADAARRHLLSRAGVEPERIAYFGESLGAAVALGLAERHPPAALVLRSPWTSLLDVARAHLPFVPTGMVEDRWESLARIQARDVPLLVVAGTRDRVVPYDQSARLFEAAPGPKRMVTMEGADHNDPVLSFGERLLDATADFLAEVLPTAP